MTKVYHSSTLCTTKVPKNLVVDTTSRDFILQDNMQKVFKKLCIMLQLGQPKFTLHEVKTVNTVQFRRYCASVHIRTLGDPIISVPMLLCGWPKNCVTEHESK